jgi:hypothetical protein
MYGSFVSIVASSTARRRLGCMDRYNTATGDDKMDDLYSLLSIPCWNSRRCRSSLVGRVCQSSMAIFHCTDTDKISTVAVDAIELINDHHGSLRHQDIYLTLA